MSKIFTFLTGIFVCALLTSSALAASVQISVPQSAQTVTVVNLPGVAVSRSFLTVSETMKQIAAAKNLLKTQSMNTGVPGVKVTLAALDPSTSRINLLSVPKESFLKRGADISAISQYGNPVQLRVVRANGVNTAVSVTDTATGAALLPLVVAYPIEKNGKQTEMAYYTSGHPELLSPEIVSAGENYVATMLASAAQRLAANGINIAQDIVNIAEHLCVVEHTDHRRFLNDDRAKLYPEIFSLYALNQGDTFRYSISTAGAGGMIQMIPRTYAGIREHHPGAGLEPDFVQGMSDHANALAAMLLYINDTWNYLQQSTVVQDALAGGVATKSELLAAGYNSNPMRLPQYLKDGGTGWRTQLPAETQMYLSIYRSVDENTTLSTERPGSTIDGSSLPSDGAVITQLSVGATLLSWLNALVAGIAHR